MKEVKVRAQLAPYNQPSTLQAPYASGVYNAYQPQPQTYSQQYCFSAFVVSLALKI